MPRCGTETGGDRRQPHAGEPRPRATLTESRSFRWPVITTRVDKLGDAISRGDIDAGVVIPRDFARDLERGRPVTVQFLLNAMNANTATIARAYAQGVIGPGTKGWPGTGCTPAFRRWARRR